MSISGLHKLALSRGFPAHEVHDILHEMAVVRFGAASLSALNPEQLADLAQIVRDHSFAPPPRSKRIAPRGKQRPEGVIWLATPKQRRFIADLLRQCWGDYPHPVKYAVEYVRRILGERIALDQPPADFAAIAAAIGTGPDAQLVIRSAIAELKYRGKWGRSAVSGQRSAVSDQPSSLGEKRNLIRRLAAEMNWSQSILNHCLRVHCACDSLEALADSRLASELITKMLEWERGKREGSKAARQPDGEGDGVNREGREAL